MWSGDPAYVVSHVCFRLHRHLGESLVIENMGNKMQLTEEVLYLLSKY